MPEMSLPASTNRSSYPDGGGGLTTIVDSSSYFVCLWSGDSPESLTFRFRPVPIGGCVAGGELSGVLGSNALFDGCDDGGFGDEGRGDEEFGDEGFEAEGFENEASGEGSCVVISIASGLATFTVASFSGRSFGFTLEFVLDFDLDFLLDFAFGLLLGLAVEFLSSLAFFDAFGFLTGP